MALHDIPIYIQNLATIGLIGSDIICLRKSGETTDRRTETADLVIIFDCVFFLVLVASFRIQHDVSENQLRRATERSASETRCV